MCRECISASSDGICLFCASRLGAGAGPSAAFPYSRDHYTFDGLLNLALSRWKQNWLRLSAVQAVVFLFAFTPAIAIGAITFVSHRADPAGLGPSAPSLAQLGVQLLGGALQSLAQLIMFGYCLDILEGKPAGIGRALERTRALPAALLQLVIIYGSFAVVGVVGFAIFKLLAGFASMKAGAIAVGLYAVLLLPVLIYASISCSFAMIELAHNPEANGISGLISSWRIIDGKRWSVSGVLFVSGLIAGLGMFACCVGVVASAPLGTLLHAALFLALKNETGSNTRSIAHEWPV